MNFTWKGNTTNIIVPSNSRPFTNNDPNLSSLGRTQGKANPIKHWRKQLMPYYKSKSSKQVSIDMINAPSSVVHNSTCDCINNNALLLKENITLLNDCVGISIVDESNNNEKKCVGGSFNVRRSASTNLKPNYYSNYSKYLQSKCKTHEQNSTLGDKNENGTYQGTKCSSLDSKCNKPIIYKPSNKPFMEQGSVSASANILRKRNNAITNNSASLKTAYGNTIVHKIIDDNNSSYKIQYKKGNHTTQTCISKPPRRSGPWKSCR